MEGKTREHTNRQRHRAYCHTLETFCNDNNIEHIQIEKGKPMQNGNIERFNGSYRKCMLDAYILETKRRYKNNLAFGWKTTTTIIHTKVMVTARRENFHELLIVENQTRNPHTAVYHN
jgi:transposase InsO family protein